MKMDIPSNVVALRDARPLAEAGADYAVTTFQQGGLDTYRLDIEIP